MRNRRFPRFVAATLAVFLPQLLAPAAGPSPANRLTYLDESSPFHVHREFPKLITPQWVGEAGVEAVVILSIDDLKNPARHDAFLRPLLERLKRIDGRAPVSVMANDVPVTNAILQAWLKEGVSIEVHTVTHRHPLLSKSNFHASAADYHEGVALVNRIPGQEPVAIRLPYCDSLNVASPRFYREVFGRTNAAGQFLAIDSSVAHRFTTNDSSIPRELVFDASGAARFDKYLPVATNGLTRVSMEHFGTTIADYPYPYVIDRLCWEFPIAIPSDWEAHNAHGSTNSITVDDWMAALDATVLKQGVFTLCFHPHGWIRADQIVGLIDHAVARHGRKVKFLTFREAFERLNANLLAGEPLRAPDGSDNGVRLLDVNHDGCMDLVIGNSRRRVTRVWNPERRAWRETPFPADVAGVRFGVVPPDGNALALLRTESASGAWHFDGRQWVEDRALLNGLAIDKQPVLTARRGHDAGVRFRDFDRDGRCELLVGNHSQNAIFAWSDPERTWTQLAYALPSGASVLDGEGRDAGLRFVDLNGDRYDDVVFSGETNYVLRLFVSEAIAHLGWKIGWNDEIISGRRTGTTADPLPPFVRSGPHRDNGAWFHAGHVFLQNEDTAQLPDAVERRSFHQLLRADQPPPLSPQDSLATIRVHPGFKVELVAQEPLTLDPVWFDWSADGRLWVVEMGDYPLGVDGNGKPGGVVRFLEDTNADGLFDKSTVFLDNVNYPDGLLPWRDGVIVATAPDVFYAEDADGDGRADVRKVLFSGFAEGNQQHRVNGFDYGLDNWLHAANGDSGGVVKSRLTGKQVNIRGRDVRLRPDDGAVETTAGQTQYGRHRDDWGNWFGNNNVNWLWHYPLPEHYLVRNPHLPVKSMKHLLAQYPDAPLLYPISRFLQRFNWPDAVNSVTAASAAMPYRDDLFGPDFATSVFICDPVYQVIHREVLAPAGVTFSSRRASSETNFEFFASADNWCRPVFTKVGPDGALYVADMYRFVIEHPEWIPERMQARMDLRAGDNLGRIYRVYPAGVQLRPAPRLDQLDTAGLVAALDHPNGWQRDTVQRLLVHRADPLAAPQLENLFHQTSRAKTRIQALSALDGLNALSAGLVSQALRDPHPFVREHAVRVAEVRLRQSPQDSRDRADLETALLRLVDDAELRVRYQLAFTLGEWPDLRASRALSVLARRDFTNDAMQIAILSSAVPHVDTLLEVVFDERPEAASPALLEQLLGLAMALGRDAALVKPLQRIGREVAGRHSTWQFDALAGLLDALDRRKCSWGRLRAEGSPELQGATMRAERLFDAARALAAADRGESVTAPELPAAIRLLGRASDKRDDDLKLLSGLLRPQVPPELQQSALNALRRVGGDRTGEILLRGWRGYSPALRVEVLNVLCRRAEWLQALLGALERQDILAAQIDPGHQQTLLTHAQTGVRQRAEKLFASTRADLEEVLRNYQVVMELGGVPERARDLFQQNCATCHQFKGQGTSIGADLASVADKPVDYLLTAILDPNRAVEARFISYTAVTRDDSEFTGIITAESPNSITMRNATGEMTILRTDLQELASSSLSLMPEGFEATFQPQALADLIALIKSAAGGD